MDEALPSQSEQLHTPEDQTSPEVKRAVTEIEATETAIAEQTGLNGQKLTDTTDDLLTDKAEHATNLHASDTPQIVETALIEGALEVIGKRPEGGEHNPIDRLEKEGFGEQVTDGVRKLHEEHATLPGGESAAEVVAARAERIAHSSELDAAIQRYMQGASKEALQAETGVDSAALTTLIRGLPSETRYYLKEARKKSLAKNSPEETVPAKDETWRETVDPAILALASSPDSITDPDTRQKALVRAEQLSGGERVILADHNDTPLWGEELNKPGQILAFNGNIRGSLGVAPETPEEINAQGLDMLSMTNSLRGKLTHIIIETEDGQQIMIRRTNETNSANDQLFDIASTSKAGTEDERRPLDSSILKDVVAIVGEPLTLGTDPKTGKSMKTKSPIVKVTTLDMRKEPVDPSHPRLAKPEFRRGTINDFGEAMRTARGGSESKIIDSSPQAETTESQQSTNPYERLTPEQLTAVRDNIADSIVQGIRKYDLAEVTRASANLAAIQREIEARSPATQPDHQRGEMAGDVTYITEPAVSVIQKIVGELQKIDGASGIARAMYGGLDVPSQNQADPESRLQVMEMQSLLANISREIRNVTGSEFSESANPYASMKNEELSNTVERLKQTIQDQAAKGLDTTDYRNRLRLAGQVIQGRQ